MIVRIAGEDQFRLQETQQTRLDELDRAVLEAIERGDEAAFKSRFDELLRFVRSEGTPLEESDLEVSDVILPPADATLDEVANDFSGEGWLPE